VTCLVAAVALYGALERRADVVPILVVLSLVGFIGSVTIARFAAVEPQEARRVRSQAEVQAEDEARLRSEGAETVERAAARVQEADDALPDRSGPDDEEHGATPPEVVR